MFHYPTGEELQKLFMVELKEARSVLLGKKKAFSEQEQLQQVHNAQKVLRKALKLFTIVQARERLELWDEVALYNYIISDKKADLALFERVATVLTKLPYYLIFELDHEPKPKTFDISDRLKNRGRT